MRDIICKNKKKTWDGSITMLKKYGTHYEFQIETRSPITVIFGEVSRGYFVCLPDLNASCQLGMANDANRNARSLAKVLKVEDAINVATALESLSDVLKYPEF